MNTLVFSVNEHKLGGSFRYPGSHLEFLLILMRLVELNKYADDLVVTDAKSGAWLCENEA